MSAHESMEHAEHAEDASGSNKKIALLIAVIALCLALSETLGKGSQTESISKNVEFLQSLGLLPGQEHPPHYGPDPGRSGQAHPPAGYGRGDQDGAAKADRRLEEDRGAIPL